MLLNNFFEIVEENITPDKVITKIKLNPEHEIYLAHFPGNPVTPGVVQIQIVKEILENTLKKELRLLSLSRCNFLKILNPNETPVITITAEITNAEHNLKVNASGSENENRYFKLSAVYQ